MCWRSIPGNIWPILQKQFKRKGRGGVGGCGLIKAIPPREQSVSSVVNSCSPQPPTLSHSETLQKSSVVSCRFHTEQTKQGLLGLRGLESTAPLQAMDTKAKAATGSQNIPRINAVSSHRCWAASWRLADPPPLKSMKPASQAHKQTWKTASFRPRSRRCAPGNPVLRVLKIGSDVEDAHRHMWKTANGLK